MCGGGNGGGLGCVKGGTGGWPSGQSTHSHTHVHALMWKKFVVLVGPVNSYTIICVFT